MKTLIVNNSRLIKKILFIFVVSTLSVSHTFAKESFQQGIQFFNSGEYDKAAEFFKNNEKKFNSDAEFHYHYGLSLLKADQAGKGIEQMELATEIAPDNAEYHYALGIIRLAYVPEINVFRQMMAVRSIKSIAAKAVELDPSHVRAVSFYTGGLMFMPSAVGGDVKEGKVFLDKLRLLDESYALQIEAGFAHNKEEFEKAESLFLKALEINNDFPAAQLGLANHYLEQKQFDKAIDYANEFIQSDKHWADQTNSDGQFLIALAYYHLGDMDKHKQYVELAMDNSLRKVQREMYEKTLDDL